MSWSEGAGPTITRATVRALSEWPARQNLRISAPARDTISLWAPQRDHLVSPDPMIPLSQEKS